MQQVKFEIFLSKWFPPYNSILYITFIKYQGENIIN